MRELVDRWRKKAADCDVEGVMESMAGMVVEQARAEVYTECARDLEAALPKEDERVRRLIDSSMCGFNGLSDREKWSQLDKYKGGSFLCPGCFEEMGEPHRASPFHGSSVHCDNCDEELTHRTPGGQSDPFNWILDLNKWKKENKE